MKSIEFLDADLLSLFIKKLLKKNCDFVIYLFLGRRHTKSNIKIKFYPNVLDQTLSAMTKSLSS